MYKITQPTVLPIAEIINDSQDYKTYVFDYQLKAKPGQYLMIWLPGVDLKPFAVAWQTDKQFAITVLKIGPFTAELFKAKPGGFLGFTGPYGTWFDFDGKKKILLIGGGSGTPSVTCLAQAARQVSIEVDFVLAAKTKEGIIYEDWLAKQGVKVYHRFQNDKYQRAWDLITELIDSNDYDAIYACGPELLLKRVVDLTLQKDVFCQISMERYMKCGFGICGKCCVDPLGICLCEAGPVVSNQLATQITEFGRYHRDNSGQKVYFNQ
ncbi:MAG TPA: dihydroorotate dehydrogenase electron transfer subunit [Patescibacteria group bacterium]|nr:dihydroorotate dehydrogenase electron transfer subunit [Patescibacteria group bacterium]